MKNAMICILSLAGLGMLSVPAEKPIDASPSPPPAVDTRELDALKAEVARLNAALTTPSDELVSLRQEVAALRVTSQKPTPISKPVVQYRLQPAACAGGRCGTSFGTRRAILPWRR